MHHTQIQTAGYVLYQIQINGPNNEKATELHRGWLLSNQAMKSSHLLPDRTQETSSEEFLMTGFGKHCSLPNTYSPSYCPSVLLPITELCIFCFFLLFPFHRLPPAPTGVFCPQTHVTTFLPLPILLCMEAYCLQPRLESCLSFHKFLIIPSVLYTLPVTL